MKGRYSIAVAGTHGKTTTSGLIAHMLVEANLDPTYLIGGEVRSLGSNAAPGEGKYIVVEADEYDRAFLSYTPDVAVVTNIEPDHLDIYSDVEDLAGAFRQFIASVPESGHVIANADSERLREAVAESSVVARDRQTFALEEQATWTVRRISHDDRGQTFSVENGGGSFGDFRIELPGRHNVSNALAGIAAGNTIGIERTVMQSALASYRGAQRRFEYIGEAAGVTVMDDYAHHPTEVRAGMLQPARERFGDRRLVVLFQPHTYSRTAYLLDAWKAAFRGIDVLFIGPTYAAREEPERGMSGEDLARAIESPAATSVATLDEAVEQIAAELREGDVFFTVGAGDVNSVGPRLLEKLRGRA
jgi:UDP-N-acetylmuramate--alanine ligase